MRARGFVLSMTRNESRLPCFRSRDRTRAARDDPPDESQSRSRFPPSRCPGGAPSCDRGAVRWPTGPDRAGDLAPHAVCPVRRQEQRFDGRSPVFEHGPPPHREAQIKSRVKHVGAILPGRAMEAARRRLERDEFRLVHIRRERNSLSIRKG